MGDSNNYERDASEAPEAKPDWDAVIFRGEDAEEILRVKSEALNEIFGRPGSAEDMVALLSHYLPFQTQTPDPFGTIRDALYVNAGEDATGLIFWLAEGDDFASRMKVASRYLSMQSVQTLYFIFSRHGDDLRLSLRLLRELPDDWRKLTTDVWYDEDHKSHEIEFIIYKQNNEVYKLRCPPLSVLSLARVLVGSLPAIPNIKEYFTGDLVEKFRSEVNGFYDLLKNSEETAEDDQSDGVDAEERADTGMYL